MLNELSPWHLIIILLLFALLFGAKRLPDAARGLGRSMRIFKAEMASARDESPDQPSAAAPTTAPTASAAPTTTPVQDAVPHQAAPVADAVPSGAITVPTVAPEPAKPAEV